MKLERLSEQNQKYYAAAKALYEEAFPVLERRDDLEQARIMKTLLITSILSRTRTVS